MQDTSSKIGDAPRRREDPQFLTGSGAYLDDLQFEGMCHAVFLRSPHAHARIERIDTSRARAGEGVLAILTIDDADSAGLTSLPPSATANPRTGRAFDYLPQPLLARGVVRHAGEAIALIVAETPAQALDAAELIEVDYTVLPAVTAAEAVLADDTRENICFQEEFGDAQAVAEAMRRAAHVVELTLDNPRIVTSPMEPRGVIGHWDADDGRYTLHVSSQNIHLNRDATAASLGVEPGEVRFIAPDVGGAFGVKNFAYPEMPLIAWAARLAGRPVKWIATRSEMFLSDHQARDHHSASRLALDSDGRFLALETRSVANLGAYMVGSSGGVQSALFTHLPGTVYDIPAIALHVSAVLTNRPPLGVTRAPGFSEANFIIERLIDTAAHECGFDPADIRRRNVFRASAMPVTNAMGESIDSGDFGACVDAVLGSADRADFAARRTESEARGHLRGFGFACHIKATGGPPHENAEIRFGSEDHITLVTGTQSIGQGHETSFPQIVGELLGVPDRTVRLLDGDTDRIAAGGGHGSSRSTYMAGTAIWRAVQEIVAKGTAIAADALESSPDDIEFAGGRFVVAGTDRAMGLFEVARLARDRGTPLDTYDYWVREHMTFPNGAHAAEIEIDRETGVVTIERYTVVDDYGVVINPMIVEGQVHGALAQGLGQALLERTVMDADGQPLTASLMDYALPRADDLPFFGVSILPTRCTTNPLGVKGAGEAAVVGAPSAIANAIVDALQPFGVRHFDGAATPGRVWRAINGQTPD